MTWPKGPVIALFFAVVFFHSAAMAAEVHWLTPPEWFAPDQPFQFAPIGEHPRSGLWPFRNEPIPLWLAADDLPFAIHQGDHHLNLTQLPETNLSHMDDQSIRAWYAIAQGQPLDDGLIPLLQRMLMLGLATILLFILQRFLPPLWLIPLILLACAAMLFVPPFQRWLVINDAFHSHAISLQHIDNHAAWIETPDGNRVYFKKLDHKILPNGDSQVSAPQWMRTAMDNQNVAEEKYLWKNIYFSTTD